jgi:ABC-type lipoprotein export system ATPase subunit
MVGNDIQAKSTSAKTKQNVVVDINDVHQSFQVGDEKVDVLKEVSFKLKENTFNIIYGPSGSGKSTLLNILTGLQKPTTGTVLFDNKALYDLSPNQLAHFRANQIGIVYQQNYWVKSLNVIENVSMPLFFLGYTRSAAAKIAMQALDRVEMSSYAKKHPSLLSGGEQQRIAMARGIVNDPLFIIADEPTGNLDSKNGDMIMGLLQKCQTELKRTIILVTHNMEYIPLADDLLHIEDGHVVEMMNKDITTTADTLLDEMKQRIDRLAKAKQRG